MRFLKKSIIMILVISVLTGSAGCGREKKTRFEAEFLTLFDTVTQIVGYAESEAAFTEMAQLFHGELKRYHELYDIFHDYAGVNNIKTINDHAGDSPVKVDQKILDLLLYAIDWYEKSDGTLNIAMGSVLSIWHDYRDAGIDDPDAAALPDMTLLKKAAEHTSLDDLKIDKAASTVMITDPEMRLDVGAIAKGYAVEQVCRLLEEKGYQHVLVSVGGNVRAIGSKYPDEQPWQVGIKNPNEDSEEDIFTIVNLSGQSLVTSGDYDRYYMVNDIRYHHLIDPETLMPATHFHAVSIICADSGMADALSTALFVLPIEDGKALIASIPEAEAVWFTDQYQPVYSSGFEAYMKQ